MVFISNPPSALEKPKRGKKMESKDVERALNELLEAYSHERPFSPWERHCLWAALTFTRFGYFEQALKRIRDVLDPPFPLPAFPSPRALTPGDLHQHLRDANDDFVSTTPSDDARNTSVPGRWSMPAPAFGWGGSGGSGT